MTRAEALKLLAGYGEVNYDLVDDIFAAFGFETKMADFASLVYYHPKCRCGIFNAPDDDIHILTEAQKGLILNMLRCVQWCEATAKANAK